MDILLDSNIYRSDISLRSKDFDVLNDYLQKTNSELVIPQIVLDEILGLYKRVLLDRSQEANKSLKNLNLMLINPDKHFSYSPIDIEQEVAHYKTYLFNRLKAKQNKIIPYDNTLLPFIAHRAIERKKPSGEKGQGFRDTLIWLTMLDYCKTCEEKKIVFISNNTDDFSNADKLLLHESLLQECDSLGVKVNYFKNLKEFIERHSSKIDFLTLDWIDENLDFKEAEALIKDDLEGNESRGIISYLTDRSGGECAGYHVEYVETNAVDDLFIYEMSDNKLIVNLTLTITVGLEGAIQHNEYFKNEYTYFETTTSEHLQMQATISFEVVNKEINNIELSYVDY